MSEISTPYNIYITTKFTLKQKNIFFSKKFFIINRIDKNRHLVDRDTKETDKFRVKNTKKSMENSFEFLEEYGIHLNEEQQEAVKLENGQILLSAVPGSGKTTVLLCRMHWLMQNGVLPQHILMLTFSREAVRDMHRRYRNLFGEPPDGFRVSTIHSFALEIIHEYARKYNKSPFAVLKNMESLLLALYRQLFLRAPEENELRDLCAKMTFVQNQSDPDAAILELEANIDFASLYRAYQQAKRSRRVMDFDDMLRYAKIILEREPILRSHLAKKYHYIQMDEAQDTSILQYELVELLAKEHGNLFVAGDEDQSIYSFRGACAQAMLDFPRRNPNARVMLLQTNYRSTAALVRAANGFIARNHSRFPKVMHTQNEEGKAAKWIKLQNRTAQYAYLVRSVKKEQGSVAILYRNNESALPLADYFEKSKIPFQVREHRQTVEEYQVMRDIRAFWDFACDRTNGAAFRRIYFILQLGLRRETMEQLVAEYGEKQDLLEMFLENGAERWQRKKAGLVKRALDHVKKASAEQALKMIKIELGYSEFLKQKSLAVQRDNERRLDMLSQLAENRNNLGEVFWRIEELTEQMAKGVNAQSAVVFSTIHSAKGQEFDSVYLIDAEQAAFSTQNAQCEEEESRLFYVAVTRAKSKLRFVTHKKMEPTALILAYMSAEKQRSSPKTTAFVLGQRVSHSTFGTGTILGCDADFLIVEFDQVGIKRFALSYCMKKGILTPEHTGSGEFDQ